MLLYWLDMMELVTRRTVTVRAQIDKRNRYLPSRDVGNYYHFILTKPNLRPILSSDRLAFRRGYEESRLNWRRSFLWSRYSTHRAA